MESFRLLIDAHDKAKKLEKAIRKERRNLIKEFKNKSSSDSNWFISKITYTGFAEQLKKETAKFDKLLQELDNLEINDDSNQDSEIMNNFQDSDSDSDSSSSDPSIDGLVRNSVPMTENLSVDQDQKEKEEEEPEEVEPEEVEPAKEEEEHKEEKIEMVNDVMSEISYKDMAAIDSNVEQEAIPEIATTAENNTDNNENEDVKSEQDYPTLVNYNSNLNKKVENKTNNTRKITDYKKTKGKNTKINTVRSGYKYEGRGFRVFTGPRNRNKPIYSMTMLYCYETCNENEKELRNYLIKFGKFKPEMIENITFKGGYNGDYALIGVRAPLKIIKKKIKTLNKAKGGSDWDMISIFERTTYVSAVEYINASNVLYVNNFDLLKKGDHFGFTKLMLSFGELTKDVSMGCDKNGDPYAIVTFRDQDDAVRCFDSKQLMFNGKRLQVRFSKFN